MPAENSMPEQQGLGFGPPAAMQLPAGETCAACSFVKRCRAHQGVEGFETVCVFMPSRFTPGPRGPIERKRDGLERAEQLAQKAAPSRFLEIVRVEMKRLARERAKYSGYARVIKPGKVSADDAREYAERIGLEAPPSCVWGAIFKGLEWKACGMKASTHPPNNGRRILLFKLWADEVGEQL